MFDLLVVISTNQQKHGIGNELPCKYPRKFSKNKERKNLCNTAFFFICLIEERDKKNNIFPITYYTGRRPEKVSVETSHEQQQQKKKVFNCPK